MRLSGAVEVEWSRGGRVRLGLKFENCNLGFQISVHIYFLFCLSVFIFFILGGGGH